jgi:hypothetical protein
MIMTDKSSYIASRLRDLGYCAATLAWSVVGFAFLVAGVSVTASLLVFVVGLPVWLGFVHLVHASTGVSRRLAGWQRGEPVVSPSMQRRVARGLLPSVRAVSSDRRTWRELGWLAADSIVGFALGLATLTASAIAVTWVSLPAWYWAVPDPKGHYGLTNLGMVVVDTPAKAVAVCGVGLALVPLALLFAGRCASAHAAFATRVLGTSPVTASPVARPRTLTAID